MRKAPLLLLFLLSACQAPAPTDRFRATGETIAMSGGDAGAEAACFTCHGLQGEGDGRAAPRLAGLDAGYLHRQLDDYANGRREHAAMRAIVRKLGDGDRSKVSAFYAAIQPAAWPVEAGNPAGARLYDEGDPARGLPSCASCHGVGGVGDAANPPLAGQSAAYVAGQLRAWREAKRNNDPLGEMRRVSRLLSVAELAAVSRHAASFPPHPPEARATSPAARRADPRNDVSEPRQRAAGSSRRGE
ncbi:MAG: c-type cytochrome [Sphingomonadales bacterium]|nr:c-type cytochrome [Sphingomonadales bacterium]